MVQKAVFLQGKRGIWAVLDGFAPKAHPERLELAFLGCSLLACGFEQRERRIACNLQRCL
jgi:hypothetical protein